MKRSLSPTKTDILADIWTLNSGDESLTRIRRGQVKFIRGSKCKEVCDRVMEEGWIVYELSNSVCQKNGQSH